MACVSQCELLPNLRWNRLLFPNLGWNFPRFVSETIHKWPQRRFLYIVLYLVYIAWMFVHIGLKCMEPSVFLTFIPFRSWNGNHKHCLAREHRQTYAILPRRVGVGDTHPRQRTCRAGWDRVIFRQRSKKHLNRSARFYSGSDNSSHGFVSIVFDRSSCLCYDTLATPKTDRYAG